MSGTPTRWISRTSTYLLFYAFILVAVSETLLATAGPAGPKVSLLGSPKISTVAGDGSSGYSGDGEAATDAQINYPYGVKLDSAGNIYIADSNNYVVRVVNTQNIAITVAGVTIQPGNIATVAGTGQEGYSGDGEAATSAELGWITDVAVDSNGNIYIADEEFSVVRKVSSSGTISTFAGTGQEQYYGCGYNENQENGDGGPATSAVIGCPYGVAVDSTGNVFITDLSGSRIRKVDTEGTITTVAGSGSLNYGCESNSAGDGGPAASATLGCPVGLALDSAGNVYIADYYSSTIRVVNMQASAITIAGITIQPGNIDRVVGDGSAGFSGDDGPAASAQISHAFGVAVDALGNIYVADTSNNRIRKVDLTGTITTLAGTGDNGYSGDGGPATDATFSYPTKLATGNLNNIYVADEENNAIRKISDNAGALSADFGQAVLSENNTQQVKLYINADVTITGVQASGDFSLVEEPASIRQSVRSTNSMAVNLAHMPPSLAKLVKKATETYVAPVMAYDQSPAGCVGSFTQGDTCTLFVKFTPSVPGPRWFQLTVSDDEETSYKFGLTGVGVGSLVSITPGIIHTPAGGAEIGAVTGIVRDNAGNSYIADYLNHVILKIDSEGGVSPVAGVSGEAGYDGDGGLATSAHLNDPISLTFDSVGNLYIADTLNNAIRKVDSNGIITTVAGTGTAGYSGDGSLATNATLDNPVGVLADKWGNLYIGDTFNNVVRKVDLTGKITTVAGNGYGAGNGGWEEADPDGGWSGDDGAATEAQLNGPTGLALDADGNLYIADTFNSAIRKVDGKGTIWTVAGLCGEGCESGYSGDGGLAASAELSFPYGLAVDAAGDLYIADTSNGAIRKVDVNGVITTVAAGSEELRVRSRSMSWRAQTQARRTSQSQIQNIGDGGLATSATIYTPVSVWVDNDGSFYLADVEMGYVRMVDVSISIMNFGAVDPGSASASQTVTVSNAGNATLTFTQLSLATYFGWISNENACSVEASLESGASCELSANFLPLEAGDYEASISIADNTFDGPHAIVLQGMATQPDYSITADPTSLTIHRGQTGTATLTVTPQFGYTGTIQFACAGLPAFSSCTFQPASVTIEDDTPVTVTLTVTTTGTSTQASVSAPAEGPRQTPGSPLNLWLLPAGLAGVVLFGTQQGPRKRGIRRWLPVILCTFLMLGIVVLNGCGSSSTPIPQNVTPTGTYSTTVTTTADGGGSGGQHSAPITITVVQ